MNIDKVLIDAVAGGRMILFAGAGLSALLGVPTWDVLMDRLAVEAGFAPEIFRQSADYMVLAEYYELVKGPIGSLRSWMDREWHGDPSRIGGSIPHSLITKLGFPIIYTTNYDRWIEFSFDSARVPYSKIRNVGDLRSVRPGVAQIVKFHGDFDDDDSIVMTESQYFRRLSFEHALDIKLRADTLERGVLFIGYSLSDINIRYLLFRLQEIWRSYGGTEERPQSYIFLGCPNVVEERVLAARGITPIVSDLDDRTEGLTAFLQKLYDGVGGRA